MTPLRITFVLFLCFLVVALFALYSVVAKLSARLDRVTPPIERGPPQVQLGTSSLSSPGLLRQRAPKALDAHPAAPRRHGLQRLLADDELDELFRIRSELDTSLFGSADAELLLPLLRFVHGEHHRVRGKDVHETGGFVDVGANIGDVSERVLGELSDHARRFYLHHLGSTEPRLVDAVHPLYNGGKLAFLYAVEPSEDTRALLQRRAAAGLWAESNFILFPFALTNATGEALFCSYNSGSGQSSLAGSENGGIFDPQGLAQLAGERKCATIQTLTLVDLLDAHGELTRGRGARVFLLKIDVEGAEAVVLEGAWPLFAAKRVSYVLFENHAKWEATQRSLGNPRLVTVGEVVGRMRGHGYTCFYVTPWGLLPFEVPATPSGDKERPGCSEGLPFCARHRLYNRQFWVSSVPCAARSSALFPPLHHSPIPRACTHALWHPTPAPPLAPPSSKRSNK